MFKVDFTPLGFEDLSRLDRPAADRIIRKIEWLAKNVGVIILQPLKGQFQGMFKLTVGDWRVLYTTNFAKKTITIHIIGHRRDIYK